MSFGETIFLFVLALVIFGPKKLPEIARQVGKYLNEFKRASNEFKAQIEQEISNLEHEKPAQQILPPAVAPEGTASRTTYAASELTQNELTQNEPKALEAAPETSAEIAPDPSPSASEAAVPSSPEPSENIASEEPVTTSPSQESHA